MKTGFRFPTEHGVRENRENRETAEDRENRQIRETSEAVKTVKTVKTVQISKHCENNGRENGESHQPVNVTWKLTLWHFGIISSWWSWENCELWRLGKLNFGL